jgi:catechol 2,3-dioxygenase-like lactoylglutathione lyase family enzyme
MARARLVGLNHVALEVGNVEEALAFYGRVFELQLRGRSGRMAFVDLGDQFVALAEGRKQAPDDHRHFGLVVDSKETARAALLEAGVDVSPPPRLLFQDPWGNNVEVVEYGNIQFTKAPEILSGMGPEGLQKSERALEELRQKGLAPSTTPVERLWACFEARDWDGARAELHDDFECEWPQTSERFVGPDAFVAMNRAYPDIGWHIEVQRVVASGDAVAAEVRVPSKETVDWCSGFYTLRDGKVWRAVEYWTTSESSPPPNWRAPFRAT